VEISPTPTAPKNKADERFKPAATVLYRALQARGDGGLTWREAWMVLDEGAFDDVPVGPLVIWMRGKGVNVVALYRDEQTTFVLENSSPSSDSSHA